MYYRPQKQYAFLHTALLEAFTVGDTTVTVDKFSRLYSMLNRRNTTSNQLFIDSQFQVGSATSHVTSSCDSLRCTRARRAVI